MTQLTPQQVEGVAAHLQDRVAQIVKQYETDIAILKVNWAQEVSKLKAELKKYQDAEAQNQIAVNPDSK